MPIIWTVAQAARVFPGEGGFYNYCKSGINETAGFIANWAYLLGYIGTASTITTIIRDKLIDQFGISFIAQHPMIFLISFITIISLLNLVSVKIISRIQSTATILKLFPLFFILFVIVFYWNPSFNYRTISILSIGSSIPFAIFGFWGFESCCSISHLIKGGPTQASKVILLAFAVSAGLYTLFHLGVMHIMGLENLRTLGAGSFPAFMGLQPIYTKALIAAISAAIMLSFINTTYGASFTNITNISVMARKGFLFGSNFLSKTIGINIPINAVLIHAICIITLITFIPNTVILGAITNFGVMTAFLLTLIAVLRYNFSNKNYIALLITLLSFISLFILLYFTWTTQMGPDNVTRTLYATPILVGIPLGLIMYKILTRKAKTQI
jgi:amino acid transporter